MLDLKREDERRILAAEINLKRLYGVSKLERGKKNEAIIQDLIPAITLVEMIRKRNEDYSNLNM